VTRSKLSLVEERTSGQCRANATVTARPVVMSRAHDQGSVDDPASHGVAVSPTRVRASGSEGMSSSAMLSSHDTIPDRTPYALPAHVIDAAMGSRRCQPCDSPPMNR
jgi:hypothetical protein